ncbi:spore gernimation protein GerA [Paenibacillus sp. BIHB 4019]|uniref:Spore gernimation protein GerA n=1 Tax=Paenibacillus sp. BIHB 4019 TaxID=1870819 RepID=A0A1B2DTM7_9BACL|nr:spore germination protein [Paenibacillus sp. BIHB 4019]ANY71049.1 spore gernimation protein GerA [Paenibacillus sp. BIHB 4019]
MWSVIISHLPDWKICAQAILSLIIAIALYYLNTYLRSLVINKNAPIQKERKNQHHAAPSNLSEDYEENLNAIKQAIGSNSDVHFREFQITEFHARATLVFIDGMQNEELISKHIMKILMADVKQDMTDGSHLVNPLEFSSYFQNKVLPVCEVYEAAEFHDLKQSILMGFTALFIEGMPQALLMGTSGMKTRAINEPSSEALLRGPRIGFTELLSENTSMLRRQGFSEDLEINMYEVGTRIKKKLVIAYMKEIVNPDLLQEVRDRVGKINMDFIAESGYVEQLIEDDYLSPFQQAQNTERPDRVISGLLEGRIAILLDGTPFALIVPVTFSMLLQSPEDYYDRWLPGTLLRMLRFFAAFLALMAPALYISFISFHPGLIPTELAVTIIETRQGVPFPSLIEVMILEISIEILREAGIRLPKPIGPAMGIVGGLIIGEAAVQAGIVSPFLVIVVAVTAISSFSIPVYSAGITLRILRFAGMLCAAVLGMFGTILFFLIICGHLSKLKSFGVPYVTPISPFRFNDWKDLFLRAPLPFMNKRPDMMKTQDKKRR